MMISFNLMMSFN